MTPQIARLIMGIYKSAKGRMNKTQIAFLKKTADSYKTDAGGLRRMAENSLGKRQIRKVILKKPKK